MRYKPTTTSSKFSVLASLECEELQDDDHPVVDLSNQALRSPVAGGLVRRREPRKAAPLCGKLRRHDEGGCGHGCCEARSETNMHTGKAQDDPIVDFGTHGLRRRELRSCSEREMQNLHPFFVLKQM